jgi:hypothetical protein
MIACWPFCEKKCGWLLLILIVWLKEKTTVDRDCAESVEVEEDVLPRRDKRNEKKIRFVVAVPYARTNEGSKNLVVVRKRRKLENDDQTTVVD